MPTYASHPQDDPSLYSVKARARVRAGARTWVLKLITSCLAVAGIIVLIDLGLTWSKALTDTSGRTSDPTPVAVFLGDQRLTIPANMIRFENQRVVGPQERMDLAIHWPSLTGYSPELRSAFLDDGADAPLLFMTIRPRETATDSAGRLASVYQHFFEGEALPAPKGLLGRRLSEDSGLAGEEVYFEAGSTSPFTVHCLAADDSGYPAPCLTEIHAGESLSVQIRFRKGLLSEWAGIKRATRALLLTFGLFA
ncbi:hypothetical protein [Chthonobacter rhizosphaerae]|uniref:hypothetical protein n=1 Tax=Chthonobacter rhizosphaerae TaxID=2735553 RepID=UPI0015EE67BB|nr:hypothetical protein [Chthonobacter rhizosphaerae]